MNENREQKETVMNAVDYFQAITYILIVATFIAMTLAFLHLLYGKEEKTET